MLLAKSVRTPNGTAVAFWDPVSRTYCIEERADNTENIILDEQEVKYEKEVNNLMKRKECATNRRI